MNICDKGCTNRDFFFADTIADYFYVIAESGYNGYTLPFKSCEVRSKLVVYFLRN